MGWLGLVGAVCRVIVDHGRIRRDQKEMVRLGLARDIGKIVITEGILLGQRPIAGDVLLLILRLDATPCATLASQAT